MLGLPCNFVYLVNCPYHYLLNDFFKNFAVLFIESSCFTGFNSYVDVTYPFTNFGIVTDGRRFQFFANQLNTLELWKNNEANPVHNLCYYTPEMTLYEAVEDNKIVNFNRNVIEHFVTFLLCQPEERGYDMKPTIPDNSEDKQKVEEWILPREKIEEVEEEIVYDAS